MSDNDIKVGNDGFVRSGHSKICRVTNEGLQFQTSGRRGEKAQVTVSKETMRAILDTPLTPTSSSSILSGEGHKSGD